MELYRLCPVLEVRKTELNTALVPVYEIDRKPNEPVHKTSSMKEDRKSRSVLHFRSYVFTVFNVRFKHE